MTSYLIFLRENAPWLFAGALLSFLSSFGQTFFISVFAGEIRATFDLSHGAWGGIYTLGTVASAALMVWAGGLADRFRTRVLGVMAVAGLGAMCFVMALNIYAVVLPFLVFALRFCGQGMLPHLSAVSMSRWFVATRGKALAFATFGFAVAEAGLPVTVVALKRVMDWHQIWIAAGLLSFAMVPVIALLLRRERSPVGTAETEQSPGLEGRHWQRGEVLRHPLFWGLLPALMAFPAFGTAFWFNQVHFAETRGWEHLALVAVFPLGTLSFFASTAFYGWAIDRFGTLRLLPVFILPYVAAFVVHAYAPHVGWVALGVVLMGMAGGGYSTIPNACWAEFFGTRHIGSIKSAVAAIMVLGSALGPGISGWLLDLGVGLGAQYLGYAACFALSAVAMLPALAKVRLAQAAQIDI